MVVVGLPVQAVDTTSLAGAVAVEEERITEDLVLAINDKVAVVLEAPEAARNESVLYTDSQYYVTLYISSSGERGERALKRMWEGVSIERLIHSSHFELRANTTVVCGCVHLAYHLHHLSFGRERRMWYDETEMCPCHEVCCF
mmetsp:Transcript_11940/g.25257  ORF Transcript_11940/g.25257 Transcript_11940/m.25257 type:complete len:143 (-) Transcript_11940:220-648(-)